MAAVSVAALAVAVAAERVMPGHYPTSDWLPDALTGLALVASGLILAALPGTGWTPGLLVASGLAWFVPNFAHVSPAWLATAASNGVFLHRAPLLHAVVGCPTGRAREPIAVVTILAVYAAAFAPAVWQNDVAATAIAALVVASALVRLHGTVGRRRRLGFASVGAAAAFAGWVGAAVLSRRVLGADTSLLSAYQLVIVAVALLLTVPSLMPTSARADVVDLVVELRGSRMPALRDRLAAALGDPSLQVGYWVPEHNMYADAAGRPLDLTADSARRTTALDLEGLPDAVLLHDPTALDDPELLQAVASATRLGVAHARLQAEVRARVAEADESRRRIVDAAADARQRLERRLTGSVFPHLERVDLILRLAGDDDDARAAREQLGRARDDLVRFARGLHPSAVVDEPLAVALRQLVTRTPVPVDLEVTVERVPERVAACIWFVCAESLSNAVKHAAASRISVRVEPTGSSVLVRISDDGVGGADSEHGSGLTGLADRVAALGGVLSVDSPAGGGTSVTATLPMAGGD